MPVPFPIAEPHTDESRTMSTANHSHDIYDPPPAPVRVAPPQSEPVAVHRGDVLYLLTLAALLVVGSVWAWSNEPVLGLGVTVTGLFIIGESWLSGLTFLHRHHEEGAPLRRRWTIFTAALAPWLLGVALAVSLMLGLFMLTDWTG